MLDLALMVTPGAQGGKPGHFFQEPILNVVHKELEMREGNLDTGVI